MSKRYHRFFWVFLKKQEDWLNSMAAKGLRLTAVGKSWYDFEDCEPGKYQYAVEFVAEKSGQSAREYASFLEDCGYRVLFKNLNLDYSVGKVVARPWADRGGRLVSTGGSYNRELLIVEKVNDGRPFRLHTSEEDIKAYRRTLRRPVIFAALMVLVLLIIFGSMFVSRGLGLTSFRSATRLGYVGTELRDRWSGSYRLLDGSMEKVIYPGSDTLRIDVETGSGTFDVQVRDSEGEIIFDGEDIGTQSFDVAVSGKVTVRIEAEKHKGSFSIE